MNLYVIGSLRNPLVPTIGEALREDGHDVFDDWFAVGPHADDHWRDYEIGRGRTFEQALHGRAARNVYAFDLEHLRAADAAVLVLPAGKSAHMELGWMLGRGRLGYVLLDSPDRWDVMYKLSTGVYSTLDDLRAAIRHHDCARKGIA